MSVNYCLNLTVTEKTCCYTTLALTFSECAVDFRWLTRITLAHFIDGNDSETVGHVGPQREDSMLLVPAYSHQLFPTPLLQVLVLKLNDILCRYDGE